MTALATQLTAADLGFFHKTKIKIFKATELSYTQREVITAVCRWRLCCLLVQVAVEGVVDIKTLKPQFCGKIQPNLKVQFQSPIEPL